MEETKNTIIVPSYPAVSAAACYMDKKKHALT
jgi:hypothetical protein